MSDPVWQVIVVEDEYDSVQMVSKILSYHGIDVLVAHNGEECMKLLEQVQPTLIVTDLAMPEMNGWETLAAIRANPRTERIPVVAMTAYHSVDMAEEARLAGFDAFYAKPISPKSFVQDIARLVEMQH
jgi:CheY-like chemotaxis protein